MALIDVKNYYITMLQQYQEAKQDLQDFEQALQDGYITEEKLATIKNDLAQMKINVDRLSYIMFLFNQPKRKNKKVKYINANLLLDKYFTENKASQEMVIAEDTDVLQHLRNELKQLKE